jgi:CHAD domain-containing protein
MPPAFTHPDLTATRLLRALGSWGLDVSDPVSTTRTVLDTFDGRLHAAGLRLELVDRPQPALLLHTIGTASVARLVWSGAPTWPAELPVGPFRARIEAVTKERALLPLLTMRSSATAARRADRRQKTTLTVEVHEHPKVDGADAEGAPPWVLEVVPVSGHPDEAAQLTTRLAALGCELFEDDAVAVAARSTGAALSGHQSSPTVPLERGEDALHAYRRVLENLAATVEANLDGTIAAIDPEFLHELRVAVRRTRSVLAQGKDVLPADIRDRYREAFGWLGQITGPPRDLDVYVLGWDGYVSSLGPADVAALECVRAELDVRRAAAHRTLAGALQSDETTELLSSWRTWLTDPVEIGDHEQHVGPVVAARIRTAQKKVLRDGRAIHPDSHPERLHDLRKDTKKLRYLLECFGSLFPTAPRKAFVSQLKALQENLGDHQDAEVHLAQLRDLARDLHAQPGVDSDVLLAMGRLSDHLDRRRVQEREDFAVRFSAYDTKANRRSLDALLDPLERS